MTWHAVNVWSPEKQTSSCYSQHLKAELSDHTFFEQTEASWIQEGTSVKLKLRNLCKEHAFEGRRAVLNMSRVLKENSATLKQEITLFIKQDIVIPWVKKKKWNRKQNLSSKTTRIIFVLAHVIRRWKHKHLSFLGKEHQNGTGPLSVLKQNLIKLHSSLFRLLNLHLRRKLLSGLNKCNLFCSKFVFFFTGYFHSIEYINSVLHLL